VQNYQCRSYKRRVTPKEKGRKKGGRERKGKRDKRKRKTALLKWRATKRLGCRSILLTPGPVFAGAALEPVLWQKRRRTRKHNREM